MASTFTAEKDGFTGTLRTLTLNVKVKLVPNDKGDSENLDTGTFLICLRPGGAVAHGAVFSAMPRPRSESATCPPHRVITDERRCCVEKHAAQCRRCGVSVMAAEQTKQALLTTRTKTHCGKRMRIAGETVRPRDGMCGAQKNRLFTNMASNSITRCPSSLLTGNMPAREKSALRMNSIVSTSVGIPS
nr:DUF736 family protein [Plasticicumulans acidivorans]